jgi:MFS family permease
VTRDLASPSPTPDVAPDLAVDGALAASPSNTSGTARLPVGAGAIPRGRAATAGDFFSRTLINRNYAIFMAGSFVSATGSWAQAVAIGWLVLDLGDSTFLLGLTNFASMVPLLVLSFPAGAIVDRFDRRKLLFLSQGGAMVVVVLLAASAVLGLINIPLILGLSVAGGLFNAVGWPTWSVFIKDLVGPEQLRSAVAMNTARFNLTRVIGPAIAGVLLAQYGAASCLVIAAVSSCGVFVSLLAIRTPPPVVGPARDWLGSLHEGLVYVNRHPTVRSLLLFTGVLGFLALPLQSFLPAYARDVLGRGPETLGILLTAIGVGAIGGAALSGSRLSARRPVLVMSVLTLFTGVSMVALAFSQHLEISLVVLGAFGAATVGYLAIANATVQLATREDIIGRVMGLWTVVNAGMMPVGALVIGAASDSIGVGSGQSGLPTTFAVAGVGSVALGAVMLFLAHRIQGATGGTAK